MNPISAFFVRNIIVVFFFSGLAFFIMGVALALASRQTSEFRFAQAIRPLAAFGILHGIHEWVEMFQKISTLTSGYAPTVGQEVGRLAILVVSFLMLMAFGILLLNPQRIGDWQRYSPIWGIVGLWALGLLIIAVVLKPPLGELVAQADGLARYSLGIPGALLGTWALMEQQRTFREHDMPQFGRDLVWCATGLFLYGVVGQIFVRHTSLMPSIIINSTLFLQWFGIPVQLFRGVMAAILTFAMIRALRAFELENRRRLEAANQAKLAAQAAALETERRISQGMERLYEELQLTAHELSLLLDLSNILAASISLKDRLQNVLEKIVHSLNFSDAGMILLSTQATGTLEVRVSTGFSTSQDFTKPEERYNMARDLGEQCIAKAMAMCRHTDNAIIEFLLEEALETQLCRQHESPVFMISLPLTAQQRIIGSLVLVQPKTGEKLIIYDELKLMVGIAERIGLSIENATLYQEVKERERMLAELLHEVVGAQEAERKRIARELHDATGQSLTAIALGLRGIEALVTNNSPVKVEHIRELKSFGTNALGELRQLISDLRPPQLDDLGLVAALQWYIKAFEKRSSIHTEFVVEGERARLPSEYETVLFRITQEALTNIAKHANATYTSITLEMYPTQIQVTIKDNGHGFEPKEALGKPREHSGWGLLGIRERTSLLGGQYKIDSSPGQGTCIQVSIPLIMETKDVEENTTITG